MKYLQRNYEKEYVKEKMMKEIRKSMRDKKKMKNVWRDIREDEIKKKFISKSYKKLRPEEKIKFYWEVMNVDLPDAERRKYALESYLNYSSLSKEKGYEVDEKDHVLNYKLTKDELAEPSLKEKVKDGKIRITADIMTNAKFIMDMDDSKKDKVNKKLLNAFYRAVYTIGNCCPVWKNKGGRDGANVQVDGVWCKLKKTLKDKEIRTIVEQCIEQCNKKDNPNNFWEREADQIFSIFHEKKSWKDIAKALYFQDYFDENWELLIDYEKELISKEELENYILKTTKLILQRGYRIEFGVEADEFSDEAQKDIKEVFRKFRIKDSEIICCKKNEKKNEMY